MLCSVVIPVYNQVNSLLITLAHFGRQTMDSNQFEVIVIDDGSTDELMSFDERQLQSLCPGIRLFHCPNKGRASARNNGIRNAQSDNIIFCDGDRFPDGKFVEMHYCALQDMPINIGPSYDYWGPLKLAQQENESYRRFCRLPTYFKKVISMFDTETAERIRWMGFLVGNSSVRKTVLQEAGMFDESFSEWGFEHFELGWRMGEKYGYDSFALCEAANYHIPHPRANEFYRTQIEFGIEKIRSIHPTINPKIMFDMLCTDKSINTIMKEYYND